MFPKLLTGTNTTRITLVCILASVAMLSSIRTAQADATGVGKAKKPNVVFILVDDLGWGDLGSFHQNNSKHSKKHKTPFLDQMANQGMQLRTHYCPAPVCAPSRASLFLGVHQGHAGVRNNQFDKVLPNNHTLGTVMQAAGYKTALIGKYGLQGKGNSPESWPGYPTKRGFDEFFGYVAHVDGHLHYPGDRWALGNSDTHRTPKKVFWNNKEVSGELQKCYTTDLFTARSKDWIAKHVKSNPDQPFFLCLTYDTPHAALQVPTVEYPAGKGINGGLQWTGKPGAMINTATGTIDSYRHPDYVGKNWTDVEERFATMVRRIDHAVGDLMQTLRDLKIAENTMVVFTSDNGPHHESYIDKVEYNADSFQSYGPFDGTKRDCWEGGIRMPSLVWWPGSVPAETINNSPSQFHDWMPTMANVAGIPAPARTDGVSLLPSLMGKDGQRPSTIYIEYQNGGKSKSYKDFREDRRGKRRREMQVIQLDGFKGVRSEIKSHADPFEIYDLSKDPGERNDLAGSSDKFIKLQQAMKDRVLRLRVPNGSAKRPYDNEFIPGYDSIPEGKAKTKETFYAGKFDYLPDVSLMEPASSGSGTAGVSVVESYFHAKEAGEYEFKFSTSTKGQVQLHDATIFDADFGYQAGKELTYKVKLGKGYHPRTLTVLTDGGGRPPFKLESRSLN